MWVGGVADSQTRSKPLKKKQITPKIASFDPNFTFRSVLHKKVRLGLGVQVHVMTKAHKALTVVCDCMQYLVHLANIVEKNSTDEIFSSKIAHKMCISRHS